MATPQGSLDREQDAYWQSGPLFYNPVNLVLTCATEGAEIYYEVSQNGYTAPAEPTQASTKYEGPIQLTFNGSGDVNPWRVKAVAFKDGVSSAVYDTWTDYNYNSNNGMRPKVVIATPEVYINGEPIQYGKGSYYNNSPGQLTITCATESAVIYYDLLDYFESNYRTVTPQNAQQYQGPIDIGYNASGYQLYQAAFVGEYIGLAVLLSGGKGTVKPTEVIATSINDVEFAATRSQHAGSTYDLQGRRVNHVNQKGVYIVDGKEKVVK